MQLSSNGVLKRLYRQAYSAAMSASNQNFQQLDFQAVTPLLVVLGTGAVLSLFLFVVELTVHHFYAEYHKHTTHRQRHKKLYASAEIQSVRKATKTSIVRKKEFVKIKKERSTSELKVSGSFYKKIRTGMMQENT